MALLGIAHFTFHEGGADDFKRLSQRCMEIVQDRDTGTLRYEIFLTADESAAVVIEEYVDAVALMEHGDHLGEELSTAILATGEVHGELLGDLDPGVRARFDGSPVRTFVPFLARR
ncbi:MAG TPA: antibiotic biosynthesis monooxygenase [Amnibacterium sp.]|jgi:quinol monooxygenase YgiN|uniref:putative quinol monooxygenase n=1 Tax=Amnibacterium sp. TaxID=1872496 RepID=UPI002F91E3FA